MLQNPDIYTLISVFIALLFASMAGFLLVGFFRWSKTKNIAIDSLAIIVPFKNENEEIGSLIKHLRNVMPDGLKVNVFLINDHSVDFPENFAGEVTKDERFALWLPPKHVFGKKAVLRYAIEKTGFDWILTLDADARPARALFTVLSQKCIPVRAKLVLIPLKPKPGGGLIRAFFDLDFLSLHFTGLAAARLNIPVLANGASLLINRAAFLKSATARTDWDEPSGDDIFALFAIRKIFGSHSIAVLPGIRPLSTVTFPTDIKSLWQQRLRWIGKVNRVNNIPFQVFAWLVLLAQLVVICSLLISLLHSLSTVAIGSLALIIFSEIALLTTASILAERSKLIPAILPAVVLYPFYLFALIISRIFMRPQWK